MRAGLKKGVSTTVAATLLRTASTVYSISSRVPTALAQFAFVAVAFAALTACYVSSDFSVANVFENSHSAMPLVYKFTSVWGNHEGSMLLWVLILSLFGALVAATCRPP